MLRLTKPLPICIDQAREIGKITGIELTNIAQESNLIELIAALCLPGQRVFERNDAFYAALPDQNHCYYINSSSEDIKGILIERIAFTHPTHVPKVLNCLRKQVRFNVIISSIIRQMDVTGELIFGSFLSVFDMYYFYIYRRFTVSCF